MKKYFMRTVLFLLCLLMTVSSFSVAAVEEAAGNETWIPLYGNALYEARNLWQDPSLENWQTTTAKFPNVKVAAVSTAGEGMVAPVVGSTRSIFGLKPFVITGAALNSPAYIVYEISSTQAGGFEELKISFRPNAIDPTNSGEEANRVRIYGSDRLEDIDNLSGGTMLKDYYSFNHGFGWYQKARPQIDKRAVQNDAGESFILTDLVKGKSKYYIKFVIQNQNDTWGSVGDISFSEKGSNEIQNKIASGEYTVKTLVDSNFSDVEAVEGEQIHNGNKGYLYKGVYYPGEVLIHDVVGSNAVTIKNGALTTYAEAKSVISEFGNTASGIVYELPIAMSEDLQIIKDLGMPYNTELKGFRVSVTGNVNTTVQNTSSFIEVSAGSAYSVMDLGGGLYSLGSDLAVVKDFSAYKNFDEDEAQYPSVTNTQVNSTFVIPADETFKKNAAESQKAYLRFMISAWDNTTTYINSIKIEGIYGAEFPVDFGGESLENAIDETGKLTATSTVTGILSDEPISLVVAVYEKETKRLIGIGTSKETPEVGIPTQLTAVVDQLDEVKAHPDRYYAKAFVWNGMDAARPLSETKNF